ncbi:MAG: hypothetical protein L0191_01750 [Acidobacteria bacterium]|nr:hypothetical protein [Acidobacteriota bacterium]
MPHINVAQIASVLARKVPALLSDLFALPIPYSVTKRDTRRLRHKIEEMLPLFQEMEQLGAFQLPQEEHARRVFHLVDGMIRGWAPTRIPRQMHGLDWMQTQLRSILDAPIPPLVRGTRYRNCQRSVRRLIIRLRHAGKLHAAHSLWEKIAADQGVFIIQPFFRGAQQQRPAHVLTRKRSPSMADIDWLLGLYKTHAGVFEKQASWLVSAAELLHGREPALDRIERQSLGEKLDRLKKEPGLAVLARGIDRTVRNAIAHETVQLLLREQKVRFRDRVQEMTLTLVGLVRYVREAMAATNAVMLVPLLLVDEQLRIASRMRRSICTGTPSDLVTS